DSVGDGKTNDGVCKCVQGYSDCDGNWDNGCETHSNCCGANIGLNDEGYCGCAFGYNDCDGDWRNGCETQGCCYPNMIVTLEGNCGCAGGHYDCDRNWDNGCESTQPCMGETGEIQVVVSSCGPNQKYVEGACQCLPGYFDCDNDGTCESTVSCFGVDVCADKSCGSNSKCDASTGNCVCNSNFYDCNGAGNGADSDGCESNTQCDSSCFDVFCGENSYCVQTTSECACNTGYYDCDGDVNNGCESTESSCGVSMCADSEICNNGKDDDCNGLIDFEDPECSLQVETTEYTIVSELYYSPETLTVFSLFTPMIAEVSGRECYWTQDGETEGCNENEYCDIILGKRDGGSNAMDVQTGRCITQCETDYDCPENMKCMYLDWSDKNVCSCLRNFEQNSAYFNCDGNWDNGCESQDATCGGAVSACQMDCSSAPNRVCNVDLGQCECQEGYYDCDGDWDNGCESTQPCGEMQCITDADCAAPRCSEWGGSIRKFKCIHGDSWFEEKESFMLSGSCEFNADGQVNSWANFDVWGQDKFLGLQNYGGEDAWCKMELDSLMKEREEIQKSLNDAYLTWYLDELVANSHKDWKVLMGGVWEAYGLLMSNTERTARALDCLGIREFPEEYAPINAGYSGEFGSIRIWEEKKSARILGPESQPMAVLSPYMNFWIFPPRELFKTEMVEGLKSGGGPKGPSPREVEEIKQDEEVMSLIRSVSNSFGGEMKAVLQVSDGTEVIVRIILTVSEEEVIKLDFLDEADNLQDIDFTLEIGYDFMYNLISVQEKEFRALEIEVPHWEQRGFDFGKEMQKANVGFNIFIQIINAVFTGQVRVTPGTTVFTLMTIMPQMMQLFAQGMG
ncbi:MAG: hypothetical protein PHW96_04180, partial [Candidatus Nanoarchaeia archaeon]|nr:hypothetical protein [Candidatus Nanoarchaeia archaeon]